MNYEEVSNNVYKVTLTDSYGRIVKATGTDLEKLIEERKGAALHMEEQLKKKES